MWFILILILFLLFTVFFNVWRARTGRMFKEEKMHRKDVPGFLITSIRKLIYRKTSRHGVSKKSEEKKQFIFDWQVKVFLFLVSLASLIVFCTDLFNDIKVAYTSALAFLGLAVTFLFGSIIGNIIYYVIKKIKEIKAGPPTSEGRF